MKNKEYVEFLYDLMDLGEIQDSLQESFEIDTETTRQAMLEWAKELVIRYTPVPRIPLCHKCFHKIIQPDLLDNRIEIVGCSLLTKKTWDKGMKSGNQTNCPVLPQK